MTWQASMHRFGRFPTSGCALFSVLLVSTPSAFAARSSSGEGEASVSAAVNREAEEDRLPPELAERLGHWAWQRMEAHRSPKEGETWALDEVDRFVLRGLVEQNLQPAPDTDRATWLRRVTFDLTGLPPSPEDVRSFLVDTSFDAYAKVVDRLLESPHYGERMARHWLDLMRYAETKGHEFDYLIPNAFAYRDYVIRAFEADVPYDRFLVEHVAGDLLEEPRLGPGGSNESVLGTGFWQLGSEVHSPVDLKGDRLERMAGQIDVFSRAFLGLTVACARCHDHKADPISQRDFYALAGYLESSRVRQVRYESERTNAEVGRRLHEIDHEHELELRRALAGDRARTLDEVASHVAVTLPSFPSTRDGLGLGLGPWLMQLAVQHPGRDPKSVALYGWARLDLERLSVPHLAPERPDQRVLFGPGAESPDAWIADGVAFGDGPLPVGSLRWDEGRPVGVEPLPAARYDTTFDRLQKHEESELFDVGLTWDAASRTLHTASFSMTHGRLFVLARGGAHVHANLEGHRLVQGPLHGVGKRTWGANPHWRWHEVDLRAYPDLRVHLEFTPLGGEDLAVAQVIEAAEPPPAFEGLWTTPSTEDLQASLSRWLEAEDESSQLTTEQALFVDWLLRWPLLGPVVPAQQQRALEAYRTEREPVLADLQASSRLAPALLDGSPKQTELATRGNPHTPAGEVPRRFLSALDPLPFEGTGSGRLALAQRLIEPGRPFVARVWVNRLWRQLFQRGLVPTVDDLGAMGQEPSHPELLDSLAQRFVAGGWSTKAMLRSLCLSRTYRMASTATAQGEEVDPFNRWLHRAPLKRLDAEAVRDGILAFSGRLDPKRFGPSVPIHLNEFLQGRGRPKVSGPIDGDGRRSIYLAVRRNFPHPFLTAFDLPTPSTTHGRRTVSNVPAQTLALLNDPFVRGECERLADSMLARVDQGEPRQNLLEELVLHAYGRPAHAGEARALADFLREHSEPGRMAWADTIQSLILSREFRFLR